jgi:hypothetical protein
VTEVEGKLAAQNASISLVAQCFLVEPRTALRRGDDANPRPAPVESKEIPIGAVADVNPDEPELPF